MTAHYTTVIFSRNGFDLNCSCNLPGVAMSSGKPWKDLRQFSLTVLRSLGVGKASFEHQIAAEAEALIQEISSRDEKPFDPKYLLGNAVANVICCVVLGKRYEYSDPMFTNLMHVIHRIVNFLGSGGLANFIPAMRVFIRNKAEILASFGEFRSFLLDVVASHRSNVDPGNLRDFTDAYLMEVATNEQAKLNPQQPMPAGSAAKGPLKHPHLNDKNIVGTLANLFAAGMETTATTLHWGILYMMIYPDIQKRVQAEIDAVVGRNRLPRLADKPELNFTQAVIWEVQRISSVVPLGMLHAASDDTEVQGFSIHKGTLVVANLWALFHDEKIWPEPNMFKPERFLDKNGSAFKPAELIPFSTGTCIMIHISCCRLKQVIW